MIYTTAHEIDFALPLISGEYLSGVLPPHPANGWRQKGVEQPFTTAIPQEKYLFCRFSAYLQVFLAIYNRLALLLPS
jgi:hypothetical protein